MARTQARQSGKTADLAVELTAKRLRNSIIPIGMQEAVTGALVEHYRSELAAGKAVCISEALTFELRRMETAPRDGSEFMTLCIQRAPFSPAPRYFFSTARWDGPMPDGPFGSPLRSAGGRFASRTGDICAYWVDLWAA